MVSTHRGGSRADGGAGLWLVLSLAILAVLAAVFLVRPSWEVTEPVDQPDSFDQAAADAALGELQQRLSTVVQNDHDPRSLVAPAEAVVDRFPNYVDGRVTYAQILFLNGRHADGYQQLEHALELDPKQAKVHILAGSTAMRLERYQQAQRHYDQAVSLEPEDPKHRLMLATAQLRQGRYDQARMTLLKTIQIDSSFDAAYATLADVYAAQNRVGLALDQITRALSLVDEKDQQRREVYLRKKARLQLRNQQPAEAMRSLRALPVKRLVDPEVSGELANIWMRLQQPERAAHHYEQILIMNPAAAWAAERATHYRLEAGDLDKAQQNLTALRGINPRDPRINEFERQLRDR